MEISELCTKDSAVVYCNIDNSRILICSGYLDITQPVVQDWLSKVVKYAENKDSELLIGVDTNCHSNLRGALEFSQDRVYNFLINV